MNDKIKELKDLLFELDSKYSVSIPETQKNINEATKKIVKLFAIPVVVNCLSCGKNHAELCGSCVSDIAQGTAEQAISSR